MLASAPPDTFTVRKRADEALARSQARADKAAGGARAAQVAARQHARAHSLTGLGWLVIGRQAVAEQARLRITAEQAAKSAAWAAADYQTDRAALRKALPLALQDAEQKRAEWTRQPKMRVAWQTLAAPLPHQTPSSKREPTDPREAAIQRLHAAEAEAATPAALAAARAATAAALAGDPDTIAAAGSGDFAAAMAATNQWQQRRQEEVMQAARQRGSLRHHEPMARQEYGR